MGILDKLELDIANVLSTSWSSRLGEVVPSSDTVALSGGAVELDATFLYADLANSSRLARDLDRRVASKILKSFLATSTRLIRASGGEVISFDGDRVLGVFLGNSKNTSATKCALQINWVVQKMIRRRFESNYRSVGGLDFRIAHGVGIDSGEVMVVRAGIRGTNDLISIGRAPSLAARLSEIREGNYHTFIASGVYGKLHDSSKFGGQSNQNMWERRSLTFLDRDLTVYRSNWSWKPS